MSIYGTIATFSLTVDDKAVEIDVQAVRAGIDFPCDYLPAPRVLAVGEDEFLHPRAVLFVPSWSGKAGPGYGSQQYHDVLLMLPGEVYERLTFAAAIDLLTEAIREKVRRRCTACGSPIVDPEER